VEVRGAAKRSSPPNSWCAAPPEPGVFLAFEETAEELTKNAASLGFDLHGLVAQNKILLDYVRVERSEIEETGEYDLEGLFIRLGHAIDAIGAKRVVLDTLEVLFAGLSNQSVVRAELRRLFRWLKDKGVTAIVSAERGDKSITRHGLEEYVSDCVVMLDHRVTDQLSTRRLRVLKYRGSAHGTNEYPFLMDDNGISVLPVTALEIDHEALDERISSGVPALDDMLGGPGFFRGSTVLVTGTAGSGKTSLAAAFARKVCTDGERCLFVSFEESESQVIRNMRSVGIDLAPLLGRRLLQFHGGRPTQYGLEQHLVKLHKKIAAFEPQAVVVDPISSLLQGGTPAEVWSIVLRLIDHLKSQHITALFTSLTAGGAASQEVTDMGVSSLVDTWLLLRELESDGERNRGLYVLKSRGMAHSNQVREFRLTDQGIMLLDVYLGPEGILTGAARAARETQERIAVVAREREVERKRRNWERRRAVLDAQIKAAQAERAAEEEEMITAADIERVKERSIHELRTEMARVRASGGASNPRTRASTNGRRRAHR
jgi:circadian clock protein KaiC